ncbi:MAG TPA: bifunctional glutamate N-acetyltransferase/amino-acid acetyltransferase ArgJ [Solirubrobacterales bacterium]|nr:bifunctional glutamate N-acetyltransferase/amino-acid acetyltransferase ArgJ [Solirubrobacterales bacterium]
MRAPEADAKRSIPASDGFFRSRWVDAPDGVEELDPAQLAPGFRAGGAHCGLKGGGRTDVGLLVCDAEEVSSALLLTRNASAAAPIRVCRERCDAGGIRAAVVNSGNANAETGEQGYADALAMSSVAAKQLGLEQPQVAVAETGTIGVPLPVDAVLVGIAEAASTLAPDGGGAFSDAILTTDRWPKRCTLRAGGVTLSAQAKGAGMIEPNMATMLCFVQTDALVPDADARLRAAVDASFNRITVDGQMSTNDTVLLQASGKAGQPLPEGLLEAVLMQLAIEIVRDGEGAARTARIEVSEAASQAEAERVARAIANSPLVKTALFGRDPNWGRIAQAAGAALVGEELPELGAENIDAAELGAEVAEAEIGLRLGRGSHAAHVWFSDLGYEYVKLNAEYTT